MNRRNAGKISKAGLLGLAILMGCSQPSRTIDAPVKPAKALVSEGIRPSGSTSEKSETKESLVGGFTFIVPGDWEEQPLKSEFTLAEYSLPGTAGSGRLTISSAGGSISENIERWKAQFNRGSDDEEARESPIKFDGRLGTLVELHGTFTDMFSAREAKKNSRMLGAAIRLDETNFFIKLTGPAATITERRDEFIKFVETAHGQ